MKIDPALAATLTTLLVIWLAALGMDIHMYNNWMSGLPRYAHDWQGCIAMTFALAVLPGYGWVIVRPPEWLVPTR